MSVTYAEPSNKPVTGAAVFSTQILNPWQGIVDEFELRDGDGLLDGVVSGGVCTIDGENIAVATIRAYAQGKRYSGSGSISFTGSSADTYYVYLDSADDGSPLKKKTTAPTAGELLLCTVDSDGGTPPTLSNLDDNCKVLGLTRKYLTCTHHGAFALNDVLGVFPVVEDWWIETVQIICGDNGSTSDGPIIDVLLGADGSAGTTIFTTTGNRPTLAYDTADYTLAECGTPDGDRKPDAGEHLTVVVDQIDGDGNNADITVTIVVRPR
jgi:hypothetical protein